jgi:hypothetical protein
MHTTSRRVLKVAAWQLAAVAIGAAAAFGAGRAEGGDPVYAHGTHNCTKYAHTVVSGSSWYATPCVSVTGSIAAYTAYNTPSYGWREYNEISLNGSRNWEVGLFDTGGSWHRWNVGTGFVGFNTAVTAAQTKAHCALSTTSVQGFCFVNNHV